MDRGAFHTESATPALQFTAQIHSLKTSRKWIGRWGCKPLPPPHVAPSLGRSVKQNKKCRMCREQFLFCLWECSRNEQCETIGVVRCLLCGSLKGGVSVGWWYQWDFQLCVIYSNIFRKTLILHFRKCGLCIIFQKLSQTHLIKRTFWKS